MIKKFNPFELNEIGDKANLVSLVLRNLNLGKEPNETTVEAIDNAISMCRTFARTYSMASKGPKEQAVGSEIEIHERADFYKKSEPLMKLIKKGSEMQAKLTRFKGCNYEPLIFSNKEYSEIQSFFEEITQNHLDLYNGIAQAERENLLSQGRQN